MYGNPFIHAKLEKRPADWNIERTPQLAAGPGLRERLALTLGQVLIRLGEKLVQTAHVPALNKKPI